MIEQDAFLELIRRLRTGDQQAAADLVNQFEPEIRVEVRVWLRLRNPQLRRVFDSMDICQAVLASFFLRVAAGQYDLDRPEQLRHLLVSMARHKFSEQVKYHQRQRRDVRRLQSVGAEHEDLRANQESPIERLAGEELLRELRSRLSEDERRLADLRAQGREWTAIAAELGGTPEGRRKQLTRAIDRVARDLGLEDISA
jgi:RNA polymerase sigma factor (sigma-70 family)